MMKPGRIRRHWSASGIVAALAFAVVSGSLVGAEQEPSPEEMALEIIEETQVRGGLIVHVGSGDGRLTAALGAAGSSYLVQGLDTDPLRVAAARAWIGAQGQYGRVCVTLWDGKTLPYADGLVNLVLVSPRQTIPKSEVLRVLAPGGAVCAKRDGRWTVRRKPWPEDIDQWTHYLCHASNNAVARDQRVGPPRRLQWTCGPQWSRSHEFNSSLVAMVSAGGRLFYIFDEGLTGVTTPSLPERWTLVA
ncbi:MAG TPA: class I SAM-dependent methyltransferase, partial [Planctomycetaceae bacterium]|nr:class I SAM-dependent methyltransferase [Planctomycetaceae bacterium]